MSMLPREIVHQCPNTGAAVPSDHLVTGTRNMVIPSVPLNAITGEPGKPAPQAAGSVRGAKNIRWGCQCPSLSLKYPCLDSM